MSSIRNTYYDTLACMSQAETDQNYNEGLDPRTFIIASVYMHIVSIFEHSLYVLTVVILYSLSQ